MDVFEYEGKKKEKKKSLNKLDQPQRFVMNSQGTMLINMFHDV